MDLSLVFQRRTRFSIVLSALQLLFALDFPLHALSKLFRMGDYPPQPLKVTHPFWNTQLNSLHTIYVDAYNDFTANNRLSPARIRNIETDFEDGYMKPKDGNMNLMPKRKTNLRSTLHIDKMATHKRGWAANIKLVKIMENWLFKELPQNSPLIPKVQKLLSYCEPTFGSHSSRLS